MNKLEALYLGSNQISEFPMGILQLRNLSVLSLSKNPLKTIPPEIARLQSLKELYLQDTLLDEETKANLKSWLPNCQIRL